MKTNGRSNLGRVATKKVVMYHATSFRNSILSSGRGGQVTSVAAQCSNRGCNTKSMSLNLPQGAGINYYETKIMFSSLVIIGGRVCVC